MEASSLDVSGQPSDRRPSPRRRPSPCPRSGAAVDGSSYFVLRRSLTDDNSDVIVQKQSSSSGDVIDRCLKYTCYMYY